VLKPSASKEKLLDDDMQGLLLVLERGIKTKKQFFTKHNNYPPTGGIGVWQKN
jgi:hypothetical protein